MSIVNTESDQSLKLREYLLEDGFRKPVHHLEDGGLILPSWITDEVKPVEIHLPMGWIAAGLLVLCLLGAAFGIKALETYEENRQISYVNMMDSLSLEFTDTDVFEYGTGTVSAESLVKNYNGSLEILQNETIDLTKTGLSQIVYRVSMEDSYNQTAQKEFIRNVRVMDTVLPEIELQEAKVSINAGDEFDPLSNIVSVSDAADGNLVYSETGAPGTYRVISEVNNKTAGSYPVTVEATDVNGNTVTETYTVNVRYVYSGTALNPFIGTVNGPSGKETYYNLPMGGIISIMRGMGFSEKEYPYWIREDGVKMLGDYVMVAANLNIRPRGSTIPTSLGMGLVCDTGGFASRNATQLDIAVDW